MSETKKLFRNLLGEDQAPEHADDGNRYCVFLAPEDDDTEPMWFSQWIKYRADLPAETRAWLEEAHAEPGESVPMFCGAQASVMEFVYRDMAEYVAEKIGQMYPELKDRLFVLIIEDVPAEDEDDA